MRKIVRAAFAALAVSALALTAANTALAQQGPRGLSTDEDIDMRSERARSDDALARDAFAREMEEQMRDSALCSSDDALAGRCMVVARLPRCPGDPRCPDPTRVRPDADTHE